MGPASCCPVDVSRLVEVTTRQSRKRTNEEKKSEGQLMRVRDATKNLSANRKNSAQTFVLPRKRIVSEEIGKKKNEANVLSSFADNLGTS